MGQLFPAGESVVSSRIIAYVIACPFMSTSDTADGRSYVYDTIRLTCLESLLKTQFSGFGDMLSLLSEAAQCPLEMQRFKVSGPGELS